MQKANRVTNIRVGVGYPIVELFLDIKNDPQIFSKQEIESVIKKYDHSMSFSNTPIKKSVMKAFRGARKIIAAYLEQYPFDSFTISK